MLNAILIESEKNAKILEDNAPAEEQELIVVDDEENNTNQSDFLKFLGLCTPAHKEGLVSKRPQRPQRACNVDPKHVRVICGESLRLFERQHRISKPNKYASPVRKVRTSRITI